MVIIKLSLPDDWVDAIDRNKVDGEPRTQWVNEAIRSALPKATARQLSEIPKRGRPTKLSERKNRKS